MAATTVTYIAAGGQQNFGVPFPYIERQDVRVYVDEVLKAEGADYSFTSASVVRFTSPVTAGAIVYIRRVTEFETRLVDFTNGAVLPEDQLNLSAEQLFFLIQENRNLLESMLTGSFVSVDNDLLQSIGQQILSSATAAEIQSRITDIDNAGQLIIDNLMTRRVLGEPNDDFSAFKLATRTIEMDESGVTLEDYLDVVKTDTSILIQDVSFIGARNEAGTAFVLDTNTVFVDSEEGLTLAEKFEAIVAEGGYDDTDIFAAVATEVTARTTADSAIASDVTALTSTVGGHTSSITTLSSTTATLTGDVDDLGDDVVALEARYGVSLNVDGHITGFVQNNDGTSGSFSILADEFYIADPGLGAPVLVFGVAGGVVAMQNAYVAGDLLVDGTITADFEFNGATIEIPTNGYIYSGSATFFDGTGWWIGTESGDPRLFFGNASGDYIRFQDGELTIAGGVSFPGGFSSNTDAGSEIGRSDTDADSDADGANFRVVHEFTVRGSGTIAVVVSARETAFGSPDIVTAGTVAVRRNGSVVAGPTNVTSATYADITFADVTVVDPTDVLDIVLTAAEYNDGGGPFYIDVTMDWSSVRARLVHALYT